MTPSNRVIEVRVCFKDKLKNTTIAMLTDSVSEARRIARMWDEQEERIGKINGIFTLPLPPLASGPPLPAAAAHAQHRRLPQAATAARRSGAQQGVVRLCAAGHAV